MPGYIPPPNPYAGNVGTQPLRSGTRTTAYAPTAYHEGRTVTENFGPDPLEMYQRWLRMNGGGAGAGSVPRVPRVDGGDPTAGQADAFARAKDRIGLATQGLLKAVRGQVGRRGIGGSSIEGNLIGSALESGNGQIGEVIRDQAIQQAQRAQAVADRNYAGDITQRGQDIGLDQFNRTQALQYLQAFLNRY